MTTYAILLTGDESTWESASEEDRSAMYAKHGEFARLLEERGHKITGGAELTHSRTAKVVRRSGDATTVTDGPYAETVEQLTGFYVVETDDLDDLLEVVGILAEGWAAEVRQAVDHSGGPA
ncbi:MAG: transcription initiation protein [Nocardioides sp.]|nr:transcription initiation protein [Nocardioidaceae bacterium]MCB8955160.1 transcription initiation protein [Nocardioides sp.]